jgi:hypothetical protein
MKSKKITFEDNKGNTMKLRGNTTIGHFRKMGFSEIKLMPVGSPLPDGWWIDKYNK